MYIKHLICCLVLLFVGESSYDDTITWDASRKLTWLDFKAAPNFKSEAIALTASGITFGYSVKTSDARITDFSTTVEAEFYRNKSWYLKGKADAYILRHEQLHFDITELYARKFRAQLSQLGLSRTIKKQMDRLHEAIIVGLDETQKRYDAESEHSMNIEMQKHWEEFIAEELQALDLFKLQ